MLLVYCNGPTSAAVAKLEKKVSKMYLHALTDGLVAVAGIYAFILLITNRRSNHALLGAIGLGILGTPAIVGTPKFLFNLQEHLDFAHANVTQFAAIVGMLLAGMAYLAWTFERVARSAVVVPTILLAFGVYLASAWIGGQEAAVMVMGGFVFACLIASGISQMNRGNGLMGMLTVCLGVSILAIGVLPSMLFAPDMAFHTFHIGFAAIMLIMARQLSAPMYAR